LNIGAAVNGEAGRNERRGRGSREASGGVGENKGGELDLGDELTILLVQDGVADNQIVVDQLDDTELGLVLHTEGTKVEGHALVLLGDLAENRAGVLGLEVVVLVQLTLEDGGTSLTLRSLTLTSGHNDINGVNLIDLEGGILNLLVNIGALDNGLVTIDDVALELVAQNTLERLALEHLGNLTDDLGTLLVGVSWADEAVNALSGEVSSADGISGATGGGNLGALTADDGVSNLNDEAVDVNTEVNLDEIALLEDSLVLRDERREVTSAVVDRDASGEGDTLVHLDLVVNLGCLILDLLVGSFA